MMTKSVLSGHTVSHDETVEQGWYYFSRELNPEESKVFFDEAYNKGSALFQDHMGYKFKLIYHDYEYQLVKPQ